MIIYLHGFRSAPASIKAQALKARMTERGLADRFWCEQLPVSPRAAIAHAEAAIAKGSTVDEMWAVLDELYEDSVERHVEFAHQRQFLGDHRDTRATGVRHGAEVRGMSVNLQ